MAPCAKRKRNYAAALKRKHDEQLNFDLLIGSSAWSLKMRTAQGFRDCPGKPVCFAASYCQTSSPYRTLKRGPPKKSLIGLLFNAWRGHSCLLARRSTQDRPYPRTRWRLADIPGQDSS